MGEFDVTRAVFQLAQSGFAAIRPPRLRPKAAVDVYNAAIALLLRELDAIDQGDGVRAQLTRRVAATSHLAQVLDGSGPSDDGTFDEARVAQNAARTHDPRGTEDGLGRWLHEHASYALFLARPHLSRAQTRSAEGTPPSPVSQLVTGMLAPIAPHDGPVPEGES